MKSHNYKKLQVVDDSLKGKLEGKEKIEGYAALFRTFGLSVCLGGC